MTADDKINQAAAEALKGTMLNRPPGTYSWEQHAAVVVAAVRPLIEAEALREAATHFVDWGELRGHDPKTPAGQEGMRVAEFLSRLADAKEAGR